MAFTSATWPLGMLAPPPSAIGVAAKQVAVAAEHGAAPATSPLSYRQLNANHGPRFHGWYCRCVVWLNSSSWSDGAGGDPDQRIGRLLDAGIVDLADEHAAGSIENYGSHHINATPRPAQCSRSIRTPAAPRGASLVIRPAARLTPHPPARQDVLPAAAECRGAGWPTAREALCAGPEPRRWRWSPARNAAAVGGSPGQVAAAAEQMCRWRGSRQA